MKKRTDFSISPRRPEETGGILLMPMKKNVPVGHPDWKLVKCPNCGRECWERPGQEAARAAVALCTECGLRAAFNKK